MDRTDEQVAWKVDGKPISVGVTKFGNGPKMLLLPAPSSISTRAELWPLQQRLGRSFATVAIDWPGFGTADRPKVDWHPDHLRAFLRFIISSVVQPSVTIAAGHAAGYALAQAANTPASLGRLYLLAPTWRGPLPTMMKRRLPAFRKIARAVDLPIAGAALYRLNVNAPVIRMMTRAHVYSDPEWLTPERMAEKRAVTSARGARHASARFVTGELDPFHDRQSFLAAAKQVSATITVLYGKDVPPKSKAEMIALCELSNVSASELPHGKLSCYEEFPDEVAEAIRQHEARRTPA